MDMYRKVILSSVIASLTAVSHAELLEMDDALMAAAVGQAGVTIDLTIDGAGIGVGEVKYTDQGSVVLQDIAVKSATQGAAVTVTQKIDVTGEGNLIMTVDPVAGLKVDLGGSSTGDNSAVLLVSADGATRSELINDISLNLDLGSTTTMIYDPDAVGNAALKSSLPDAAQNAGLVVAADAQFRINNMNIGAFGMTAEQAAAGQGFSLNANQTLAQYAGDRINNAVDGTLIRASELTAADGVYSGAKDNLIAGLTLNPAHEIQYNSDGTAKIVEIADNSNDVTASYNVGGNAQLFSDVANAATARATAEANKALADSRKSSADLAVVNASRSFVQVQGLSFKRADGGHARVKQTIWTEGDGLYMHIGEIDGQLNIAGLGLGGQSVGSLTVSGIDLSGVTQRIYGH